jgi:hypothetical protein
MGSVWVPDAPTSLRSICTRRVSKNLDILAHAFSKVGTGTGNILRRCVGTRERPLRLNHLMYLNKMYTKALPIVPRAIATYGT